MSMVMPVGIVSLTVVVGNLDVPITLDRGGIEQELNGVAITSSLGVVIVAEFKYSPGLLTLTPFLL